MVSGNYISVQKQNENNQVQDEDCFKVTCLAADIPIRALANSGPLSIILTSGTLSPLDALDQELGIPFKEKLSNLHVIQKKQIYPVILNQGVNGTKLNFKYDVRQDKKMIIDMGYTLLDLCKRIRGGILVFFPSYSVMADFYKKWVDTHISLKINKEANKEIFVEDKLQAIFDNQLAKYKAQISLMNSKDPDYTTNGCVFLGVARGKLSEGMSLDDDGCRCVVVIGIPYPYVNDPKVLMKKHYLETKIQHPRESEGKPTLDANTWYRLEGTRSVNQSLGRVIRHVNDFGVLVLADSRFHFPETRKGLPKWVKENLKMKPTYDKFLDGLSKFLKNYPQIAMPQSQPEIPMIPQASQNYDELDAAIDCIMGEEESQENSKDDDSSMIDVDEEIDEGDLDEEDMIMVDQQKQEEDQPIEETIKDTIIQRYEPIAICQSPKIKEPIILPRKSIGLSSFRKK